MPMSSAVSSVETGVVATCFVLGSSWEFFAVEVKIGGMVIEA